MRLGLIAIGRLRACPERALIDDYLKRSEPMGRALALTPLAEREIEPKGRADARAETEALAKAAEGAERVVLLDERGKHMTSPDLAALLAGWRDQGVASTAFLIGGADGFDQAAAPQAHARIAFGKMVWPHRLARVMLCEQLYRAMTILAGTPYHRA